MRNLVTTLHLPYRLDIEQMAQHLSSLGQNDVKRVRLDLCTFPGLRCTLVIRRRSNGENTLATCLFFITGTVIVTGVRQPEELEQAVASVRALCQDHQRKS
ncbi:hypothetical protein niasHT_004318 [Heterodera trifolii]|uniref:Uncharacterized protein n=1 Tax=Heterodera trifolii TaxID=157864 RepID=A0ABD2LQX6_9BILA